MTLLAEIIDGAADSTPVATLLRQLKVVASRSGSGRLADWVDRELAGYPDSEDVELPDYRGPFPTQALGHFAGAFGREVTNLPIPPMTMRETMRESGALFQLYVLQPIAEVEDLSRQSAVRLAWPADVVQYYNWGVQAGEVQRIVQSDMALMTVVRPVSGTVFLGVLDAVRNRILELALELEQTAPTAGEPGPASAATKAEVAQVVNNYNFYGSSNVAIDSVNVAQSVAPPAPGDGDALIRYLAAAGVDLDELDELRAAIDEDQRDDEEAQQHGRWRRVRAWFANATTDVTTGALGGALGTAATAFLAVH